MIAAAAPLSHQYATLGVLLAVLAIGCLLAKRPGAIVTMAIGAAGCAIGMTRFVEAEGNTINTDASTMTGPILFGALLGLFLHLWIGKRFA